jgi:ATP-binding cassette, subfamily F, member 3
MAGQVRLGSNVTFGYMAQEQENLDQSALNVYETIRKETAMAETEARTFLAKFLFTGDDVFVQVGLLSYGERARLALAMPDRNRLQFPAARRAHQPPGYPIPHALRAGIEEFRGHSIGDRA